MSLIRRVIGGALCLVALLFVLHEQYKQHESLRKHRDLYEKQQEENERLLAKVEEQTARIVELQSNGKKMESELASQKARFTSKLKEEATKRAVAEEDLQMQLLAAQSVPKPIVPAPSLEATSPPTPFRASLVSPLPPAPRRKMLTPSSSSSSSSSSSRDDSVLPKVITYPLCNDGLKLSFASVDTTKKLKTPADKVTLIHSILFNGEPMSLLTIAYLYDAVDFFIVVESLQTFSGVNRASYHLDRHKSFLEPYKDKIIEIRIMRYPDWDFDIQKGEEKGECAVCWCRETYIRNVIKDALQEHFVGKREPFMLIHADSDELPKQSLVMHLPYFYEHINTWGGKAHIQTTKFTYSFLWYTPTYWHRVIFVITDEFFAKNTNMTIEMARHTPAEKIEHVFIAGAWHCSSCLSVEDFVTKLESFSHQEINKSKYKTKEKVAKDIATGRDMLNRADFYSLPYFGQEGFPDLATCPGCASIPGFESILKLGEVAKRAAAKKWKATSSFMIGKTQQGRPFFVKDHTQRLTR